MELNTKMVMAPGKLDPEMNAKIGKLLLREQRERTEEFLTHFYHVDTYIKDNGSIRVQGHIKVLDVPTLLPLWFVTAINNVEIKTNKDNKVIFEVWLAVVEEELPF